MDESDFIKNLEGVGMNGVLLIFLFGVYKLLVSRNFISKCGLMTIDFRSKELRTQEAEYKHIQNMAEIEVKKLQLQLKLEENNNDTNIIENYDKKQEDKGT